MAPNTNVHVELGTWDQLRELALPIRVAVFVQEQQVPAALELDEWDAPSTHALARDTAGQVVGTARLLPDGHLGRMAVLAHARGRGIGTALLHRLIATARAQNMQQLELSAQIQAVPLYERAGFVAIGTPYEEAGIMHIRMHLTLSPPPRGAARHG